MVLSSGPERARMPYSLLPEVLLWSGLRVLTTPGPVGTLPIDVQVFDVGGMNSPLETVANGIGKFARGLR
jgi:hypothetical protein